MVVALAAPHVRVTDVENERAANRYSRLQLNDDGREQPLSAGLVKWHVASFAKNEGSRDRTFPVTLSLIPMDLNITGGFLEGWLIPQLFVCSTLVPNPRATGVLIRAKTLQDGEQAALLAR